MPRAGRVARDRSPSNSVLVPQGIVASTSDGGQTWQSQQLPQGVLMVLGHRLPERHELLRLGVQTTPPGRQRRSCCLPTAAELVSVSTSFTVCVRAE